MVFDKNNKSDIMSSGTWAKSLYEKTGMILLQDLDKKKYYYYRKKAILIPLEQPYINKTYGDTDVLPINKININGKYMQCSYLNEADTLEVFNALGKTDIFDKLDTGIFVWKVSFVANLVYDESIRKIRIKRSGERVSILQCVYLYKGRIVKGDDWNIDYNIWSDYELSAVWQKTQDAGATSVVLQAIQKDNKQHMQKNERVSVPIRSLLDCDKRRCRLDSYEESMLYDIKRGHWDLFEAKPEDISESGEAKKLIARDPRKDIRNGIVGIDFGTKSTVVVRQNDTNDIIPIRIGTGGISKEVEEKDFENPTVIECTDLDEFVRKYYEKTGRPETTCDDFFISYDAFHDFINSTSPDDFYAYYTQLKQWANKEKEDVSVLDKRGKEYQFGSEILREEKQINPIELYAYYIGLYINNMRNGIYLKYLMSFPVGYSVETRQLIADSFEKGIKKSLPTAVLEDEKCMQDFSIRLGISEPAAYAVTALEMSGLDPKDETEHYMYGIFDFGGGTTDFDFGIWRGASEDEYEIEGYDYVLECFGADSDVTLGGENILELLAYHIFKENKELARSKKITCSLPTGEQPFLGSETLISNSKIANRNMSILKEVLRPFWHKENWKETWNRDYNYRLKTEEQDADGEENGEYLELSLYDVEGIQQPGCRFRINTDEMEQLIRERIRKGVQAFFRCMEKTFAKFECNQTKRIYIFLAGNASKSQIVKDLFDETMKDYYQKFKELNKNAGDSYFELMEPLNTEQKKEQAYIPNEKTGVAYGLIRSRDGSSIKILKNYETDAQEQTRFKYYLGRERRHKFDCRLSPVEIGYGQWLRFQGAAKEVVRIYFTTDPMADSRAEQLAIDHVEYRELVIEPGAGKFIYIRTCEPTVIQYAVAVSEEDIDEKRDIQILDFGA